MTEDAAAMQRTGAPVGPQTQHDNPPSLPHFFDFSTAWVDPSANDDLREHIAELAARNPILLQQLLADNQDKGVSLSLCRRFIVEKDEPDHRGKIDLKQTATVPLVEGIRRLSLRERITSTSTLARMVALQEQGVLDDNKHDYLCGAPRQGQSRSACV